MVKPSRIRSVHWSKTVILQSPPGMLLNVNVPSSAVLAKAKSAPSGLPRLTYVWVKA